jgi:hypothetical protein
MELTKFLGFLAATLPLAYGAPAATASNLHPKILAAMKRDLGLDAADATARVAREVAASAVIEELSSTKSFAGAWVSDNGNTINVGVTDEAEAKTVTAAGAKAHIVANKYSKLQEAKESLDELHKADASVFDIGNGDSTTGIAAWYVDVIANKVVLSALAGSTAHAEELATEVGLAEGEFEVRTIDSMPTTFATIEGGTAYLIGGSSRCSVGFSVGGGFVTAGHCGSVGASVSTQGGESLGSFAGSTFPGDDMAFVSTSGGHDLSPYINGYGSGSLPVTGNSVAPVGSSICRSGSTTGVHCGQVEAEGVSVTYPQGTIYGTTQTSVCAEPGDSGGSFYTGAQAQGVTSGGSGNCRTGGVTYFQPVNPILSAYGLTLVRS